MAKKRNQLGTFKRKKHHVLLSPCKVIGKSAKTIYYNCTQSSNLHYSVHYFQYNIWTFALMTRLMRLIRKGETLPWAMQQAQCVRLGWRKHPRNTPRVELFIARILDILILQLRHSFAHLRPVILSAMVNPPIAKLELVQVYQLSLNL